MHVIDLHTHTLLSDGAFVPAEHIRRAEVTGYRILGIADHADLSTLAGVIAPALLAARRETARGRMLVLAGAELTHVRPDDVAEGVAEARRHGAQFVAVHGETLAEPVEPGTNRAAIEAGCDFLAHPGLITEDEARLAARRGVRLEISGKQGHCLANGHVARIAAACGTELIFGSDAHDHTRMRSREQAERICRGAGLDEDAVAEMFAAAEHWARTLASTDR